MASDSRFDFNIYLYNQCKLNYIVYPHYARQVLMVASFYKRYYLMVAITTRMSNGTATMLQRFGMTLEGKRHSAVDDVRNLARVVIRMMQDGHLPKMRANIAIYPERQSADHKIPKSCFFVDL
ncbi:hypothetical protein RvY_08449-2 [Ramazzottius varieornatus]|nr:hypothetical protein RvY_08449-2 [Ramazzottius varieornatus]